MEHEIEIPDNEDAACDLGDIEIMLARNGLYDSAAMVSGAVRRLRADADEIERLRAENARLTADLSKLRDDLETLIQQRDEAQRRRGEIEAECEALRADVVWLLAHKMIGYGDRISYAKEPRSWSLRKELDHDGTPDGILRAVREARTKWARSS